HHRISQVKAGEFDLLWMPIDFQFVEDPIVERAMILEFERADRLSDLLYRIGDAMGEIVHRIDAPFITRSVMGSVYNPVDDRIAHIEVRGGHVDLGAQSMCAVWEFTGSHAPE